MSITSPSTATTCQRSRAGDGAARSAPQEPHRPKGTTFRGESGSDVESAMSKNQRAPGSGHLWVIGYDDMERAGQVRDKITELGWGGPYFSLSRTFSLGRFCRRGTSGRIPDHRKIGAMKGVFA